MHAELQERWSLDPDCPDSGFEHVVIGATREHEDAGPGQREQAPVATHYLDSPFHGYTTEMLLLAGHYLQVRFSHGDGSSGEYAFDLGFLGADHARVRRIPWSGFALVLALLATGAGVMALSWIRHEAWSHPFLAGLAGCLLVVLGVLTATTVLRRTTETLELRSLHGQAPLVRLTGGFGSARRHSALLCDLAKSAKAARAARPRERREFLCEEMRVHHALRQSGVIGDDDYQASRARILAAHDRGG